MQFDCVLVHETGRFVGILSVAIHLIQVRPQLLSSVRVAQVLLVEYPLVYGLETKWFVLDLLQVALSLRFLQLLPELVVKEHFLVFFSE